MATDFAIILRSETDDEAAELRALRFALKRLGRQYHFRCKAIRPIAESVNPAEASSGICPGLAEAGSA